MNNNTVIKIPHLSYNVKNYADLGGGYPPQSAIVLHIILSLIQ